MSLRMGELFAGYGGLGMGVGQVLDVDLAWYADCCKFDKDGHASHHEPHRAPCSIMAHHHPDVPNLGDVTAVDWSQVEPVDVLTGGSPCQDLSHAGRRAGMTEGTRSNLWVAMREAIAQLRPGVVVWENVRGAYSAEADSDLESDPRLLADVRRRDGEPVLRALGRVLGDLSDLGYDCRWHGLRAADIGAPHGRFRVFVVAYASGNAGRFGDRDGGATADAGRLAREVSTRRRLTAVQESARNGYSGRTLLPTPRATDGTKGGPNQRGTSGDLMLPSAVALLPTPTTQGAANNGGPSQFDRNTRPLNTEVLLLPMPTDVTRGGGKSRSGARSGEALLNGIDRLLPTPRASDGPDPSSHGRTWSGTDNNLHNVARKEQWGDYAAAIARWEHILGRPAPAPTQASSKGNPQLSPFFVEWLMGLPAGHVTDVPGITRNEALKALGNGVVPQQCAAALREMFAWGAVA